MGWGFGRMGSGGCLGFVGGFILGGLFEQVESISSVSIDVRLYEIWFCFGECVEVVF